jgi:membrane protease YdiL (CAAX protease family)
MPALAYLALGLVVTLYLALSAPAVVSALQQPGKRWKVLRTPQRRKLHGVLYSAVLLGLFLVASAPEALANPARLARDLLLMALYLLTPTLLQLNRAAGASKSGNPVRPDALDAATIALIWLPAEFSLLPDLRVAGVPLPTLLGVVNALLIYLVIAPWKARANGKGGIGYTFRLTAQDIGVAVLALLAFVVVGIPLGLLTGFLTFRPEIPALAPAFLAFVTTYLFTALPEELLFRGLIQNGLERRVTAPPRARSTRRGRSRLAFDRRLLLPLLVASLFFGLAQLNNPTPGFPVPNWLNAVIATLAGLAYGVVWQRTGKITASALTHALVNFIWALLFAI